MYSSLKHITNQIAIHKKINSPNKGNRNTVSDDSNNKSKKVKQSFAVLD